MIRQVEGRAIPTPPGRTWPYIVTYELRGGCVREHFDLGHPVAVGEIVPMLGGRRVTIDQIRRHPDPTGPGGKAIGHLTRRPK
jgi:hypothetical protein